QSKPTRAIKSADTVSGRVSQVPTLGSPRFSLARAWFVLMALIHSFSHASGFAGDRRPVPTPLRIMSGAFGGQATCKRQGLPQTAAAFRPSNPQSPARRRG